MSFISTGVSAIGRLAALGVLLGAFGVAMAAVVYMSLSGTEIKVPEIVGKDFVESEKELAALGLKIKRRADRASGEKINTVLEQLPKPGETVKTGQLILVVVSKEGAVTDQLPKSLQKDIEEDDTKKIEEMISDKPKRAKTNSNSNANAKAKADTTRDTIANTSSGSNTGKTDGDAGGDKKEPAAGDKPKTDKPTDGTAKPVVTPKPATKQPAGDQRPRKTNP
jgi:beta-lactam-binding protein with PASTA domain